MIKLKKAMGVPQQHTLCLCLFYLLSYNLNVREGQAYTKINITHPKKDIEHDSLNALHAGYLPVY